mmetsp:Transcript_13986/g.23765  ORF Transcript_13986/g.23765 Transcript_13986/m.23765 type:complete len:274 (+) Transcript_13986:233-1054(+)
MVVFKRDNSVVQRVNSSYKKTSGIITSELRKSFHKENFKTKIKPLTDRNASVFQVNPGTKSGMIAQKHYQEQTLKSSIHSQIRPPSHGNFQRNKRVSIQIGESFDDRLAIKKEDLLQNKEAPSLANQKNQSQQISFNHKNGKAVNFSSKVSHSKDSQMDYSFLDRSRRLDNESKQGREASSNQYSATQAKGEFQRANPHQPGQGSKSIDQHSNALATRLEIKSQSVHNNSILRPNVTDRGVTKVSQGAERVQGVPVASQQIQKYLSNLKTQQK